MVVGAVAEIGEHMLGFGEGRLAHPGHAFAAHLREGVRIAVHPLRHVVAADPRQRAAAFRHLRRSVVRAAGAEIGRAPDWRFEPRQRLVLVVQEGEPFLDSRAGVEPLDTLGDGPGDQARRQFVEGRHDPFAAFVELADHPRPYVGAPVIELFLELVLDQRPFFLDDENLFQPFGEAADAFAFQRPGHADLVDGQADFLGECLVDAEIFQRLHDVEVGFAGGYDAEAAVRPVDDSPVEIVGPRIGQRGVQFMAVQALFLHQRLVRPADIETARRHFEIVGNDRLDTVGIDIDRRGRIRCLGDDLEGDPAAGIT